MEEAITTSSNSRKHGANARRALIVVDVQNDFLPGGALAVPHGDEIIAPLHELMESGAFELIVATQDWHPHGHISFASSHPGAHPMDTIKLYGHEQTLWPDHCVQGTPGAALQRDLPWHRASAIIRKATDAAVDSYSAFRNNWNAQRSRPPTGLIGYLKNHGVREVFICGLARDYCVRWSAEDAVADRFRSNVIWDLCRSIDPSHDAQLRRSLTARGVKIIDRADV
jgi:nicotinamidase/pyrazinamidase